MIKRILACVVLAVLASSVPAAAQTIDDLKKSLGLMQAEVDRLQAAHNATLGEQNVGAYIDYALPDGSSFLMVGWALGCGAANPDLLTQVMIDGVIADNVFIARYNRPDVTSAYSIYCAPKGGLRPQVGATFLVDLSHYAPGAHTIALRVRDFRGVVVASNAVTVTK